MGEVSAQNMPVVGATQSIILPADPPRIITVPGANIVVNWTIGKHGALVITTIGGLHVYLCNGVMPAFGQAPNGAKLWYFNVGMGATRIVVPEDMQSIGFDNGANEDISVWYEDHIPNLSEPCPFGKGG